MDFLKLVQKKEYKTDNKIIIGLVILVVLIMSSVVFWPSTPKQQLLAYLPNNVSFYYHWTSKQELVEGFFVKDIAEIRRLELESMLGDNFFNLQEVLWFQTDGSPLNDNYLLKFSRLPKSFLKTLKDKNLSLRVYSPQKNILFINRGEVIDNLIFNQKQQAQVEYFKEGVTIYWRKGQSPEFLADLVAMVEPIFVDNEILLNWQQLANGKNRLSLLENNTVQFQDIKGFLIFKNFDLAFGFHNATSNLFKKELSVELLKTFFDSLPYYNFNKEVIQNRILRDAMIWQKDDGWILTSHEEWQADILDFIKTFNIEEVPGVLSDGTAYIELIAAEQQDIIEHQINDQQVSQIDQLFLWDIGDQHYLSNKKELIEELTTHNYHLASLLDDCLGQIDVRIGDFIYFNNKNILEGPIKNYLLNKNIDSLQMVSYATGTITGINICF